MRLRANAAATKPEDFITPMNSCRVRRAGFAAARCSHRLVDRHERSRDHAQPWHPPRVGFQLRLDAGDDVDRAGDQCSDDRFRPGEANQRGALQLARQEKVIGTGHDHADARARAVDLRRNTDPGSVRHQVHAFDHDIGRRECDVGAAHRIDREKTNVPGAGLEAYHHIACLLVGHERDRHAEAPRQFAGEVGRDSAGLAGDRTPRREHRVAEVDRGAHLARGGQVSQHCSGRDHGRKAPITRSSVRGPGTACGRFRKKACR